MKYGNGGYTHALGDGELNGDIQKTVRANKVARARQQGCQIDNNYNQLSF